MLTKPSVPRALVWVFDADAPPAAELSQKPLTIIELFGDTPRSLAVTPDGKTVYAGIFFSGNQTTDIAQPVVSRHLGRPEKPAGSTNDPLSTALIVQYKRDTSRWEDEKGRDLSSMVPFSLPDKDVFLIDATANPPAVKAQGGEISGVGTILFGMAVRPDTGALYVANLESRNAVHFEPVLKGHFVDNRITVIRQGVPDAINLNPHIRYDGPPGRKETIERSIGLPVGLAFAPDGHTVYVAAMGSDKVAALDADKMEKGDVSPRFVSVGGGPSGLCVDPSYKRLYVVNRFDNTISLVDINQFKETGRISLGYDPSPSAVRYGRRFLYDTRQSAFGDQSCASCHISADFDGLAWDLGDPVGEFKNNPNKYRLTGPLPQTFHPLKGPMTTQSLRGLSGAGPMHWRGDRTAGENPGGDPQDEDGAVKKFNPAFKSLLGSTRELSQGDMQALTDFILTINYPPNPIRALDNALNAQQQMGEKIFTTKAPIDPTRGPCTSCHSLPLGTSGLMAYDVETQDFKVPHLRNLYQKVGKFGFPAGTFFPELLDAGPQVRGFGFLHDGSFDTMYTFLHSPILFFARPPEPEGETERRAVEAFLFTFDTGLKPAVGQQVTVGKSNQSDPATLARINLLISRSDAGDCDLVARAVEGSRIRGWLYNKGKFDADRNKDASRELAALLAGANQPNQEVTFTCVPPHTGYRTALDRDEDGYRDGDELEAGSNPADPASIPRGPAVIAVQTQFLELTQWDDVSTLKFESAGKSSSIDSDRMQPGDRVGDPRVKGGQILLYNSAGRSNTAVFPLPAQGWSRGAKGYRFVSHDGPIKSVIVEGDHLEIEGGGKTFQFSLGKDTQRSVGLRLTLGEKTMYCANAIAQPEGTVPSTESTDSPVRFLGQAAVSFACPPLPTSDPASSYKVAAIGEKKR
jgi:DNA-binding beta-propeller fold protein YncE